MHSPQKCFFSLSSSEKYRLWNRSARSGITAQTLTNCDLYSKHFKNSDTHLESSDNNCTHFLSAVRAKGYWTGIKTANITIANITANIPQVVV